MLQYHLGSRVHHQECWGVPGIRFLNCYGPLHWWDQWLH